jgi:hypothetical protein
LTTPTITNDATPVAPRVGRYVPLPRGLDTVDRLLRAPDAYPEPDGWQAVEAVLVGLAGREGALVREGGPLAGLDPYLLTDPRHRALWWAYERVRAAGDDVRQLDVLGAALDVADPGGLLEYVSALWGVWPSSLGVNLTRARVLLEERAETERELERVTERARARGVLPRLSVVSTSQVEPVERVSKLAVRGMETGNVDTPPRPAAVTPAGDAVPEPAGGSPALERCPSPVHRAYHDAYRGTLDLHPVACERRTCAYCGPRWVADHVEATVAALKGRDAWRVVVPVANVGAVLKRVTRAGGDYRRVPMPDAGAVLLLCSVEVPEAERVSAADVPDVLEPALSAVRTVRGAKVTASRAWTLAAVERAEAVEAVEPAGAYVGNVTGLERFERVLSWWRTACVENLTVNGYDTRRVTGVTEQAVDALRRNGVLTHPESAGEARAAKKRDRLRSQLNAIRAAVPWCWPTVEVVTRAAA